MVEGKVVGLLMGSLVFSLLGYTCYEYIFTIQASQLPDRQEWYENFNSVVALILCIISLFCYSTIMLTPPYPLPLNNKDKLNEKASTNAFQFPKRYHKPVENEHQKGPRVAALSMSNELGRPLYCYKCNSFKPERTHHCRTCNRCTAKMDHHCLWVNGCVDATNYKLFALFVFYVACYALWILLTTAPLLLEIIRDRAGGVTLQFCWKLYKIYLASIFYVWRNLYIMLRFRKRISLVEGVPSLGLSLPFHWYSVTILALLFGVLLSGFSSVHFYYIFKNLTSIESIATRPLFLRADFDVSGNNFEVIQVPSQNIYNVGFYKNWCSVMGKNPLLWFVPIRRTENPAAFEKFYPYNANFANKVCNLARLQRNDRMKTLSKNDNNNS